MFIVITQDFKTKSGVRGKAPLNIHYPDNKGLAAYKVLERIQKDFFSIAQFVNVLSNSMGGKIEEKFTEKLDGETVTVTVGTELNAKGTEANLAQVSALSKLIADPGLAKRIHAHLIAQNDSSTLESISL